MGVKLTKTQNSKGEEIKGQLHFWCPGCECAHVINIKPHGPPVWEFNGDWEKPTFKPSHKTWWSDNVCHSFITDGKIRFLGDCTHKLKGQTVDMPDWD